MLHTSNIHNSLYTVGAGGCAMYTLYIICSRRCTLYAVVGVHYTRLKVHYWTACFVCILSTKHSTVICICEHVKGSTEYTIEYDIYSQGTSLRYSGKAFTCTYHAGPCKSLTWIVNTWGTPNSQLAKLNYVTQPTQPVCHYNSVLQYTVYTWIKHRLFLNPTFRNSITSKLEW